MEAAEPSTYTQVVIDDNVVSNEGGTYVAGRKNVGFS